MSALASTQIVHAVCKESFRRCYKLSSHLLFHKLYHGTVLLIIASASVLLRNRNRTVVKLVLSAVISITTVSLRTIIPDSLDTD